MSVKSLQDYTYYAKYARWNPETKRRETWEEAWDRVMSMHKSKFPQLSEELDWVSTLGKKKIVLGSQRILQFGGDGVIKHNARAYNCFHKETQFITNTGVMSFDECYNGQEVTVLTHQNRWKKAVVKYYGKQKLNKITFSLGSHKSVVRATPNHRWILAKGEETCNIQVGDKIFSPPTTLNIFSWEEATPFEKLYWCYGYVYGDGTLVKNDNGEYKTSMVRLCDHDRKYKNRFEEMGFKTSSSLSLKGDFMAYTGSYQKTLPDINIDSIEMIRAFVRGYLDADGEKNRSGSEKLYNSIQSSNEDGIEFIKRIFPLVGAYILKEVDLTGQETNFGIRPKTSLFYLKDNFSSKYNPNYKVSEITPDNEEDVWCLEVEDDHSFIMPNGIVTGNCSALHMNRTEAFQQIMYLLLCGTGVGFSVQKHHISQLPQVKKPTGELIEYTIDDSIEGWSDSIGVLISSYMKGNCHPDYNNKRIDFNYSLIRPKGAKLSTSSGKAPGPEPLIKAHLKIKEILNKSSQLKSIEVYDIVMHIADSVLSGGVRRSATSCIFSPDDEDMIKAKTGNWFYENPQRGRSNNSAILIRNKTSKEEFEKFVQYIKQYGEPGFVFADDLEQIFNPCTIGSTLLSTDKGLYTIKELYESQEQLKVAYDTRFENNNYTNNNWGVKLQNSSPVKLTKKNAEVFRLKTKCGYEICTTEYHEFITKNGKVQLKDLKIGDKIPVQSDVGFFGDKGTYEEGLLIGLVTGDGFISNDNKMTFEIWEDDYELKDKIEELFNKFLSINNGRREYDNVKWTHQNHSGTKTKQRIASKRVLNHFKEKFNITKNSDIKDRVPTVFFQCSKDFIRGYLQGLIITDRTFNRSGHKKNHSSNISLAQSNYKFLQDVQILFSMFGIQTAIYKLHGKRKCKFRANEKEYLCKPSWRLFITKSHFKRFIEHIDLFGRKGIQIKQEVENFPKTYQIKKYWSKIESIEKIDNEDVFCLTSDNHTVIMNGIPIGQCFEISLYPISTYGESGVQFCNLCEINGKKIKTKEQWKEAVKAAAILGTVQAAYADFPYLGKATEDITRDEALLGISMTGIMDSPEILLDQELQKEMAKYAIEINKEIAQKIGINPAARVTTIKPAGSTSCVLGTSSGIHPHHAKRYIRRVQANKMEDVAQHFIKQNPIAVEQSVWSANDTDWVISFCIEVPDGSKTKNQMPALQLLENIKNTQQNWIKYGTNIERCKKDYLIHNVSNTVTVKDNEWDDVIDYIYKNRKYFAAVSLLPDTGDKDYPQAPFTAVYTPQQMVKEYGDGVLFCSGLIDSANKLWKNLWFACDTLLGLKQPENKEQEDWVQAAIKFSNKYFDNNPKKLTYCIKDVYNWKLWLDLNREYKTVDYSSLIEETDNTNPLLESACSGGKCEII